MKARPNDVNAAFLLFPTISNIGATPNGRLLTVRSLLSESSLIKFPCCHSQYLRRYLGRLYLLWQFWPRLFLILSLRSFSPIGHTTN